MKVRIESAPAQEKWVPSFGGLFTIEANDSAYVRRWPQSGDTSTRIYAVSLHGGNNYVFEVSGPNAVQFTPLIPSSVTPDGELVLKEAK